MFIVLSKVASIFLLILVGFIANRKNVLTDESIPYITKLMMSITMPCMAMSSIYSKELSKELVVSTRQVIIGAIVFFIATTLFSMAVTKLLKFKPDSDWGMYIVSIATINSGFMGFPVTKAIFGGDLFYLMVMHNIILNIYMFGIVPSLLNIGGKAKFYIRERLKSMFNIVIISIIIGCTLLILGLKPPTILDELIQTLSDATVPISMLIVGLQLGSSKLKELLNKYNVIATIVSMLLIPILTFVVVDQIAFLDTDVKAILLFASSFPTAVAPVAIAEQYHKNSQSIAQIVSLTTALSLITLPAIATFITVYYY